LFFFNSKISFETGDANIDEAFIGKLYKRYPFSYDKIKSNKSLKVPSKYLACMCLRNDEDTFYIIDNEENCLKQVDLNGKFLKSVKLSLPRPVAMCQNRKGEFFIADGKHKRIFVLDSNLRHMREFGDYNLKKPDSMIIDEDCDVLYVTDHENNQITVWNSENGNFITQIKVDSPAQIQLTKDNVYVISESDYEINKTTSKLRLTKGCNCIFIINKTNFQIVETIKLDNWFDPCGLHIDKNQNILTTAFELDSDKYVSNNRSIFILNNKGKLKQKVPLDTDFFNDMIVSEKKMVFCSYDNLKIVEFE